MCVPVVCQMCVCYIGVSSMCVTVACPTCVNCYSGVSNMWVTVVCPTCVLQWRVQHVCVTVACPTCVCYSDMSNMCVLQWCVQHVCVTVAFPTCVCYSGMSHVSRRAKSRPSEGREHCQLCAHDQERKQATGTCGSGGVCNVFVCVCVHACVCVCVLACMCVCVCSAVFVGMEWDECHWHGPESGNIHTCRIDCAFQMKFTLCVSVCARTCVHVCLCVITCFYDFCLLLLHIFTVNVHTTFLTSFFKFVSILEPSY